MPNTTPLQLDDQGVLGLLRDFEALRIWEVLRSARTAVTVAELAQATGLEQRVLQGHVDLLAKHGLVDTVRARKPRKSVGYRVSTERIVITFDDACAESVARWEFAFDSTASSTSRRKTSRSFVGACSQ